MRIVLISDTHVAGGAVAFTDNCRAAVAWIGKDRPDMAVHLGDVTADGIKDPAQFAVAAQALAPIAPILRVVPGNHDVGEAPAHADRRESALDPGRLAAFRAAFGTDTWIRRMADWTLIGLDTQVFGHPSEEARQWAWLDEALEGGRGPLGLFLHKPLRPPPGSGDDDSPRYVASEARAALAQRLAGRDLRFVASGHVHQALQFEHAGTLHVWAPSTAFILPDAVQARLGDKVVGLTVLELGGRQVRAETIVAPGMVAHDVLDHPEVYPQVAALRNGRGGEG